MKKIAASIIFLALVASECLNMDLSLATGLSLKNLLLYVLVLWILFESVLDSSGGGIFKRQLDYMSLHTAFIVLIILAAFSSAICIFILEYESYSITYAIISLKVSLIDRYLMLFVFLAAIRDSEEAVWMIKTMLIVITAAMVISLIDMFEIMELRIMDPRADGRLQGKKLNSNEYGILMVFYLPLALALAYQARGRWKAFWGVSAFIFFLVMIFSASRGALVGLVGGAFLGLTLFSAYTNARTVTKSVGVIAILALLTVTILSIQYGDLLYARFVEQTITSDTFEQSSGRTAIWGEALSMMSAAPVTFLVGFGWATFILLNEFGSHNTYFEYLFDMGFIGLSLLVLIFFNVIYQLLFAMQRVSAETRVILMGFAFGYLSTMVSTSLNHMGTPWLLVWGLTGAVLRLACADRIATEKAQRKNSDMAILPSMRNENGKAAQSRL